MANRKNKVAKNSFIVNRYVTLQMLETRMSHEAIVQICRTKFYNDKNPYTLVRQIMAQKKSSTQ